MPLYQAIVCGIVQGIAEFLPISSSGHLILVRALLRWPDPGLYFDIALHGGTLVALLAYYWRFWLELLTRRRRLLGLVVLATIPGAIIGKLFEKAAEESFRSPPLVAGGLALLGAAMWAADRFGAKRRSLDELRPLDALGVGGAQAFAVIPGVSRAGSTMSAALALGLDRVAAAELSFLMAAPIIAGATILGALHLRHEGIPAGMAPAFVAGIITSAIVGYASIFGLLRYLRSHSLNVFAFYRIAAGLAVLALAATGYFR